VIRKLLFVALMSLTTFCAASPAQSPSATKPAPATPKSQDSKSPDTKPTGAGNTETRVEKYLRNFYAWGPDFDVKVSAPKPSPIPDLLEVSVTVSKGGQSDSAVIYVSKSGQYMVRGELTDMTVDPFADTASKLHVGDSPSMGPADAKVTLIEFADFECPSCRQLDLVLREFMPKHPEARLVFKHFPLTEIHPWAMTAALATQCVYQQDPAAFWKMHDAVFDAQDTITPENAWDKLLDLATQSGANPDTYKACIANPDTANQVKSTINEGHALNITATPTTFVNNRRVVGPDKATLEQDIVFQ
jgi:protein-disulfide isomerase